MHNLSAGHKRGQRIGNSQATIGMAMPLNADIFPRRLYHFVDDEMHERNYAHGSGVPAGVADHDGLGAAGDGGAVHALDSLGIAAGRVLGHVHHIEAERDSVLYGAFRGAQQEVIGPILGIAPDGAGADERRRLDGNTSALHDLSDRPDVVVVGARRTVGLDLHVRAANLPRQSFAVCHGAWSGSGQPDIERVNSQPFHQVEDFDFLFYGRIADGRRLQAVAQRLVIQQDLARRYHRPGIDRVPIVDEISNFGCHSAINPVFHPAERKIGARRDPIRAAPTW